ncbi:MAG TPA: hypothetical protein VFG42_20160 [Baekduia sp.]|uniref:hypothetical protein n=1 Tax=Baekduia sp. TaxID=2600305 RepID=UPI002D79489C|nr:hypothetical protein [Baekduia sp.]HET6509120.1 hypothetical protein [Baekduia sp.]
MSFLAIVDLGLPQFIALGLVFLVWLSNVLGVRIAVGVNKAINAALALVLIGVTGCGPCPACPAPPCRRRPNKAVAASTMRSRLPPGRPSTAASSGGRSVTGTPC